MRLAIALLAICLQVAAADLAPRLLAAAAAGKTAEVESLLGQGAPIEAHDKDGRTPLMLAAQHGQAETVRLLIAKGASATARDKNGLSAYGLAMFNPAGHGNHEHALQALPQPPHPRVAMDVIVAGGGLISSCFMPSGQLKQQITNLDLGSAVVKEVVEYARSEGKGMAQIVQGEGDAQATIVVQPGAACEAQAGDSLSLAIEVRIYRGNHELVRQKLFASGFKGLRKQTVSNFAQYGPVFQSWIKPQAGPMYWFIVETLL